MPALKPKPAERQANHKVDLDDAAASNTATDLATEDLGTPGNLSVFQLQQLDTLLKAHSKGDRARALSYQQAPSDTLTLATGFKLPISGEDLDRLRWGEWYNDTIVHAYFDLLTKRETELSDMAPGRPSCHFMPSYFFSYQYEDKEELERKLARYALKVCFGFSVPVHGFHVSVPCAADPKRKKGSTFPPDQDILAGESSQLSLGPHCC